MDGKTLHKILQLKDSKKAGRDWAKEFQVQIMDPDGWRRDDTDIDQKITFFDFLERVVVSTLYWGPN